MSAVVLGKMQALAMLSANLSRDIKIKSQRRIDEAMCSLPFAADDRDFQTIQQMASVTYNWQSLRFEWVLTCDSTCVSLSSSDPMYTSIIQALGYYLNLKTVVIPSQVRLICFVYILTILLSNFSLFEEIKIALGKKKKSTIALEEDDNDPTAAQEIVTNSLSIINNQRMCDGS